VWAPSRTFAGLRVYLPRPGPQDLDATITVTGKALTVAVTVPALFLGGGPLAVVLLQSVANKEASPFHYRADVLQPRNRFPLVPELIEEIHKSMLRDWSWTWYAAISD
jgi:hypothetical protein